jgi:hypothetical protein
VGTRARAGASTAAVKTPALRVLDVIFDQVRARPGKQEGRYACHSHALGPGTRGQLACHSRAFPQTEAPTAGPGGGYPGSSLLLFRSNPLRCRRSAASHGRGDPVCDREPGSADPGADHRDWVTAGIR